MSDQELQIIEEPRQLAALGSENPSDIINRAVQIADVLQPIIKNKNLFKRIGEKDHVMAEGWAVLMGLINVDPIVDFSRKIEREGEIAYESRVSLMHNGRVVAAAETIASDKEKGSWARTEQGVKSMAQTRAFGKACRLKYSWLMVMAGYAPTAAEEFSDERAPIQQPRSRADVRSDVHPAPVERPSGATEDNTEPWEGEELPMPKSGDKTISKKQQALIFVKAKQANVPENILKAHLKATYGVEHSADLSWKAMDPLLKWIESYANLAKA